jgi:hypothetical protein
VVNDSLFKFTSPGRRGQTADSDRRDRRKLTFYFKADKRVDFRDLTKENFRIFKVSKPL